MTVTLWSPRGPDDLYLARGEVSLARPIFQGDVFQGLEIPGLDSDDFDLAMLVTHPCSMMTDNYQYLHHVEAVRVRPHRDVPFSDWAKSGYELLPLPDLRSDGQHYAAFFHERGRIRMPADRLTNRVAALSLDGVMALQQRLTHESSRVAVSDALLLEALRPVWDENELAETWNDDLLDLDSIPHDEVPECLAQEAKAFGEVLSKRRTLKETEGGRITFAISIKDLLNTPDRRALARQAMGGLLKKERQARRAQ